MRNAHTGAGFRSAGSKGSGTVVNDPFPSAFKLLDIAHQDIVDTAGETFNALGIRQVRRRTVSAGLPLGEFVVRQHKETLIEGRPVHTHRIENPKRRVLSARQLLLLVETGHES
jgi:hypothetical protein